MKPLTTNIRDISEIIKPEGPKKLLIDTESDNCNVISTDFVCEVKDFKKGVNKYFNVYINNCFRSKKLILHLFHHDMIGIIKQQRTLVCIY